MATYSIHDDVADADDDAFAGSHGGPLVVVPRAHLASWWGCFNAAGDHAYGTEPTDYDRACVDGPLPFVIPLRHAGDHERHHWAMVLESPDPTCFWPGPNGTVLIVRWVGADTAAGLLSVALAVEEGEWDRTDVVLDIPEGGLAVFDSAMDGRSPDEMENGIEYCELPPGRYGVDRILEIETEVEGGAEGDEEVMIQLLRLRRVVALHRGKGLP